MTEPFRSTEAHQSMHSADGSSSNYRRNGEMAKASASHPEYKGLIPIWSHTEDFENDLDNFMIDAQHESDKVKKELANGIVVTLGKLTG